MQESIKCVFLGQLSDTSRVTESDNANTSHSQTLYQVVDSQVGWGTRQHLKLRHQTKTC